MYTSSQPQNPTQWHNHMLLCGNTLPCLFPHLQPTPAETPLLEKRFEYLVSKTLTWGAQTKPLGRLVDLLPLSLIERWWKGEHCIRVFCTYIMEPLPQKDKIKTFKTKANPIKLGLETLSTKFLPLGFQSLPQKISWKFQNWLFSWNEHDCANFIEFLSQTPMSCGRL